MSNGGLKSLEDLMDFFSLTTGIVSRVVHVDKSHISLVINGKRSLTIAKAIKLAEYFQKNHKINLDWKQLISEKNREMVESLRG